MTVTKTFPNAGQIEPEFEEFVETFPANASDGGIARGLVCCFVTGKCVKAPVDASGVKPFVVAVEAKADADTQVRAVTEGYVTVFAEGAIAVGAQVTTATTTAGHVKTAGAAVFNKVVGDYAGHAGEGSGNSPYTAAANGEIIMLKLNP